MIIWPPPLSPLPPPVLPVPVPVRVGRQTVRIIVCRRGKSEEEIGEGGVVHHHHHQQNTTVFLHKRKIYICFTLLLCQWQSEREREREVSSYLSKFACT